MYFFKVRGITMLVKVTYPNDGSRKGGRGTGQGTIYKELLRDFSKIDNIHFAYTTAGLILLKINPGYAPVHTYI